MRVRGPRLNQFIKLLTLVAFILTSFDSLFAQSRSGGAAHVNKTMPPQPPSRRQQTGSDNGGNYPLSSFFQVVTPNSDDTARRDIVLDLLKVDKKAPTWPAFPRTYTQIKDVYSQETNVSFGLTVNRIATNLGLGNFTSFVSAGVSIKPLNIQYRYSFETSLVMMTSIQLNDDAPQETDEKRVVEATTQELIQEIFELRSDYRNYVKRRDGVDVIGFCVHEAKMENNRSSEVSTSFIVGNAGGSELLGRHVTHALYSQFFVMSPDKPIHKYLEENCGGFYQLRARPFVEQEFNKLKIENTVHYNSQCSIETKSTIDGDESCQEWFDQRHGKALEKIAVPRCVVTDRGRSVCQLRGRENNTCAMYLGKDGKVTDQFRMYSDATVRPFASQCDSGLSCTLDKAPKVLFGSVILWPGRATCKSDGQSTN